jgi:uncharacterized short protein YbdD (DUF466 family)
VLVTYANYGNSGSYVYETMNAMDAVPTYTNKPGVSRAQFDNYAKQIKKNNPGTKARFNYNK